MECHKNASSSSKSGHVETGSKQELCKLVQFLGNGTRFDQSQRTFSFSSAVGNITGYFITNVSSGTGGELIITDHFSTSVNVNQAGFEILVTPSIEFR